MNTLRITLTFSIAFLITACAGQGMRPPADVAAATDQVDATDRKVWRRPSKREEFQLGAYRVIEVRRNNVESTGYSFFGWGTRRLGTTFTYGVTSPRGRIDGLCELEQKGSQTNYSGKIGCKCGEDKLITDVGRKAEQGTLTFAGQPYSVKSVRDRVSGRQSDDPLGYRIDAAGAPLGAVDLVSPGRIWLRKELDEGARQQLTCLLVGVMLFRPIANSERRTNN